MPKADSSARLSASPASSAPPDAPRVDCPDWKGVYQLLDSGVGYKLEQFGPYRLIRPEPQAVWSPQASWEQWREQAHAWFEPAGSHSGEWHRFKKLEAPWSVAYNAADYQLRFKLNLTAFKHVGLFPEQAANWDYLHHHLSRWSAGKKGNDRPTALNLFAYTGGATLACWRAGAAVTHVDAIKQVVSWANENLQLNQGEGVRWLVEDALKFVQREVRRGNRYKAVLLDPPAFGHGPKGERWKLEDLIDTLIEQVAQILDPQQGLLLFNGYSLGFSPLILENLLRTHLKPHQLQHLERGELALPEATGRLLPAGVFARLHYSDSFKP